MTRQRLHGDRLRNGTTSARQRNAPLPANAVLLSCRRFFKPTSPRGLQVDGLTNLRSGRRNMAPPVLGGGKVLSGRHAIAEFVGDRCRPAIDGFPVPEISGRSP